MVMQRAQAFQLAIRSKSASNALLPSYEAILSDSVVVSSLLGDQNQKLNCVDFEQTCGRVIATMNENIQENEIPNPEIQAQSQKIQVQQYSIMQEIQEDENSDLEIHVQIHPDPESEVQKSEYAIHNTATIQNVINIADPATIQIVTSISDPSSTQIADTEIAKITTPQWNSKPQNRSQFQSQYDEDEDELDEKRFYRGSENWNAAVVVQRPPPEPPDLQSPVKELFPPIQTPTCQNMTVVAENECGSHTGAEDIAVTKGNVDDDDAAMNDRHMTKE
ncbi:hypothetical protein PIB30_026381 [Stylosanthes scabra]|uniref:Uncharacterized protein n=1 Tax=Stylosanthes scabra TaxID=79078 RepID=A0ABU6RAM4_9FABA|nr:hypothetical protein [Stylosanthes scabra]